MKTRLIPALLAFVFCAVVLWLGAAEPAGANYNYGTNPSNVGGYYQVGVVPLRLTSAAIATSGSPADIGSITVGLSRYIISGIYVESLTAAGTLALGTIDIRTATAGGGSSILLAATALTSLTTLDLAQSVAPAALGSVLTAATLTVRQTINSLNAGTIAVVVLVIPVP